MHVIESKDEAEAKALFWKEDTPIIIGATAAKIFNSKAKSKPPPIP
jgi:hypothetical protein